MNKARIGIIGGSGLYEIEDIKILEEISLDTAWGNPSDSITIADVQGIRAAFLPRHGKGHRYLPHEINYRANIAALKILGVADIFAFSAIGSLKEKIKPLDFALPDQIIDRTKSRQSTFFGNGVAAHIAFAHPFCERLHETVIPAAKKLGISLHSGETLVCMEGPAFSTRAESELYRSWGAGIINMSAIPEAKLAREAEMCYAMICMCTDYDCWKQDEEHVSVEMLIDNLNKNAHNAKNLLKEILAHWEEEQTCLCRETAKNAVITAEDKQNPVERKKLKTIFPDYF